MLLTSNKWPRDLNNNKRIRRVHKLLLIIIVIIQIDYFYSTKLFDILNADNA